MGANTIDSMTKKELYAALVMAALMAKGSSENDAAPIAVKAADLLAEALKG